MIHKDFLKLFDCDLSIEEMNNKDISKVFEKKLEKLELDFKIHGVEISFSKAFEKKFVKSVTGIVDFEQKFEKQINQFIYKQITSNKKAINLDEIAEFA